MIKKLKKDRYYIQEICCFAVSFLEKQVLEDLGFDKVKDISNECFLYMKKV